MIEHVIIDKNAFSPQLLLPNQFGLLIGQYDSDAAVRVLLHCATPDKEASVSSSGAAATPAGSGEGGGGQSQGRPEQSGNSTAAAAAAAAIDSEWIGRHAENVFRSLPGGLDIVGLFLCCHQKPSADDEQVAHMKSAIGCVQDLIGTLKLTKEAACPSHKIFLFVMADDSTDVSCLATDAANPIGGLARVPRCELSSRQAWLGVTSRFSLNCRAAVSAQSVANNNLTDQLHCALRPCVLRALDCAPLYEGAALPSEPGRPLPFDDTVAIQPGDSAAAAAAFREPVFVELLQRQQAVDGGSDDDGDDAAAAATVDSWAKEEPEGGRRLEVSGCFPLFALVRSGATGDQVGGALKADLARGLDARLHLAAQELSISSGLIVEGKSPVLRLPRRVLVRHPRCPQAVLSDYSFPGETCQDVVERLAYFFSASDLSQEDVDFGPEADTISAASSPDELSADEADLIEGVDRVVNSKVPVYYLFGLVALFVAVLAAIWLYKA